MKNIDENQLIPYMKQICRVVNKHPDSMEGLDILRILKNAMSETKDTQENDPFIGLDFIGHHLIGALIDEGIEVTIKKNKHGERVLDLNVETKSHLHLVRDSDADSGLKALTRYDEEELIDDWDDLMMTAKDCMLGRDFINEKWANLLIKEGYLEVVTETKTYYR